MSKSVLSDAIWDFKPDYVNEDGVKWWLDESIYQYAKIRDVTGYDFFLVECPDGYRTRVIVRQGVIIFESPRLEEIGVHIDILKLQDEENVK